MITVSFDIAMLGLYIDIVTNVIGIRSRLLLKL